MSATHQEHQDQESVFYAFFSMFLFSFYGQSPGFEKLPGLVLPLPEVTRLKSRAGGTPGQPLAPEPQHLVSHPGGSWGIFIYSFQRGLRGEEPDVLLDKDHDLMELSGVFEGCGLLC